MDNEDFEIIEDTHKARADFGFCYGADEYEITEKQIAALLAGKVLASTVNCGEYSIFIKLSKEDK